ncbi:hypothetical protein E3N88_21522 [Mikania micrantha]|uniref:Uncharacterized protein n=1 Tax=Mikania micrantha TaxID=192012 RepID=A0A5N6NLG1_9ASTR|nr:hypothetical protein E3N88_21522 [Mikania micrantha]
MAGKEDAVIIPARETDKIDEEMTSKSKSANENERLETSSPDRNGKNDSRSKERRDECEHHLAPRQKKYVRVGLLRSGWRIREGKFLVPGRNSCQIKMVHQEDAGLNVEMAKMIFAKGIWSYVCKMDNALRKYSAIKRIQLNSIASAITFVQKVPLLLDSTSEMTAIDHPEVSEEGNQKKVSGKSSKKLIANGLIIVGGVICLTRGHTNFSAKIAMAYILSKLTKRRENRESALQ